LQVNLIFQHSLKQKIMAVKYSVVQQKYDITGKNILKFFAKAQSSGETDFASICETISDRGTATKGDVMAAIEGCIFAMKTALKEGRIVRLGDFGSFQVGVSSEGTLTEKEFSSSKIKGAHILFRPGSDLTTMLNNLSYQKVSSATTETTEATETTETSETTETTETTGADGTGA
jgi:predicted histone-like DNA-binding protein